MEQEQRSGFWSSLPGILTGSAALITAATGGWLALGRTDDKAAAAANPPQAASAAEAKAPGATPAAAPIEQKPPVSNAPAADRAGFEDSAASADPPPRPVATKEPRPSFNCALAATVVENMLCSDAQLADRDRRASEQYFALRGAAPPSVRSQLLQSQRLFLRQRSDCRSSQCLSDLYDVRLRQLAEFASN